MATNTLVDKVGGDIVAPSFWNDIHQALNGTLVGRNAGIAAANQNLGSAVYPWGNAYINNLIVNGQLINFAGLQGALFSIEAGRTRTTSNQPQFLQPSGAGSNFSILGSSTNLLYVVNGAAITLATDLTSAATLAGGAGAGYQATLNNAGYTGLTATKYTGEFDGSSIDITGAGANITALVGTFQPFKNNTTGEIFFAFIESATKLSRCLRGWGYDSTFAYGGRQPLTNSQVLQLLTASYVFLEDNAVTVSVTTKAPFFGASAPSSPATNDYWFNIDAQEWSRFNGSTWDVVARHWLGTVVSSSTDCLYADSNQFHVNSSELNNFELQYVSANVVKSKYANPKINVYGNEIFFQSELVTWDMATDRDTGVTDSASTTYYFYVKDTGSLVISDVKPREQLELLGFYHPYNPWRCVGSLDNDASADFQTDARYLKNFSAPPKLDIRAKSVEILGNTTSGGVFFCDAFGLLAQATTPTNFFWDDTNNKLKVSDLEILGGVNGGVYFRTTSGTNTLIQDSANFFWNQTTHKLGVGTNSPDFTSFGSVATFQGTSFGGIELASSAADATGIKTGSVLFTYLTNSATYKNLAEIYCFTSGAVANQRIGNLYFRYTNTQATGLVDYWRMTAGGTAVGNFEALVTTAYIRSGIAGNTAALNFAGGSDGTATTGAFLQVTGVSNAGAGSWTLSSATGAGSGNLISNSTMTINSVASQIIFKANNANSWIITTSGDLIGQASNSGSSYIYTSVHNSFLVLQADSTLGNGPSISISGTTGLGANNGVIRLFTGTGTSTLALTLTSAGVTSSPFYFISQVDGSNTPGSASGFYLGNTAGNRFMQLQLDASNNLLINAYNGTSWSTALTINNSSGVTKSPVYFISQVDGNNTPGSASGFYLGNTAGNRFMQLQLDASNNLMVNAFNGTAWANNFSFFNNGQIYAYLIHNNGGTGSSSTPGMASGTTTPTLAGGTQANITGTPTVRTFSWKRTGNVISVSGTVTGVDPTTVNTETVFYLTFAGLPNGLAQNSGGPAGGGFWYSSPFTEAAQVGVAGTQIVYVTFYPRTAVVGDITIFFQYTVA